MEAFESFVALSLEAEMLVVSEAVKFPVRRRTAKATHEEVQSHWMEIDLVGANANRLVLATVKSFFGSHGVMWKDVFGQGTQQWNKKYALLNDPVVQDTVVRAAADRWGYGLEQVELRLYVGKFGSAKSGHEAEIRRRAQQPGGGLRPFEVIGVDEVARAARRIAGTKTYRDNPVLVAIKVLEHAGMLQPFDND